MSGPSQVNVNQNGSASFLALIEFDGEPAQKADIATITCHVYDLNSGSSPVTVISPSITANSVMFDTLQQDLRWNVDQTGYNFLHDMPATAFPTANHNYNVVYKFTSSTGAVAFAKYEKLFARNTDY